MWNIKSTQNNVFFSQARTKWDITRYVEFFFAFLHVQSNLKWFHPVTNDESKTSQTNFVLNSLSNNDPQLTSTTENVDLIAF